MYFLKQTHILLNTNVRGNYKHTFWQFDGVFKLAYRAIHANKSVPPTYLALVTGKQTGGLSPMRFELFACPDNQRKHIPTRKMFTSR